MTRNSSLLLLFIFCCLITCSVTACSLTAIHERVSLTEQEKCNNVGREYCSSAAQTKAVNAKLRELKAEGKKITVRVIRYYAGRYPYINEQKKEKRRRKQEEGDGENFTRYE